MLLSNAFDGLGASQSLCRLAAPLRVVVVVIFESLDLVFELLADFDSGAVAADFGRKRDVSDVGEGVVHRARFGVISA